MKARPFQYAVICFSILLASFLFLESAFAARIRLTWDPNTESDLTGYKVYYGTSPRTGTDPKKCGLCGYSNKAVLGNVTTYPISNLDNGQTYYFSLTASDTLGNESSYSNEVSGVPTASQSMSSEIGIYRNGAWYLDLNGNDAWDGCTVEGCLGPLGGYAQDKPVTGDWNGTGSTKIGIYRRDPTQNLSYWYLDNGDGVFDGCGTFPTQDLCLGSFGGYAQDIPVTGDWNGSGSTKIGIYRRDPVHNLSYWYLDNGNGQWDGCGTFPTQDLCLGSFGGYAQDIPVTGDWNGDGSTKIGIYRRDPIQNLSYWYLDNGNGAWDGCTTDGCFGPFGGFAQDIPVTGDWNGDGKTKIGIYRRDPITNLSYWYLDNGNGRWDGCGTFPTQDLCLGSFGGYAQDIPVVGKW